MIEQAFAQADPDWLRLQGQARQWLGGPLGELLLAQQRPLLEAELARLFGGYLVHYGPGVDVPVAAQIQRSVRVGAPFSGVEIACEEQAWPLGEHAADVVVLQHGLDFSLSPHGLLREAARSVRPGGHLLIVGINPWSAWGLRHLLARDALRQARCIAPARVSDWLHLLGFALEKRRLRMLSSAACLEPLAIQRLAALESLGRAPACARWRFLSAGGAQTGGGLAAAAAAPRASRWENCCPCRWPRSAGATRNPN